MKTEIHPNPTTGEFTITVSKLKENATVEVYNTLGQIIKQGPLTNLQTKINLSEHPNGVYFTRITENSKPIYFSKIIKRN